jgi:hypothetical protein
VLTPDRVLDPGTRYVVGGARIPTSPDADCLGPPGGSGESYPFSEPVALGLLSAAGRANRKLNPLLISDQFGFGLLLCGIGGAEAEQGETFWYLKRNHEEATVGADQLEVSNGDEILFYLAPDAFPAPNPKELELEAPARARPGEPFSVRVVQHGCVTDPNTFEVTCDTVPAAGVAIAGAPKATTTGPDGTATIAAGAGRLGLTAARAGDIQSKTLEVCLDERLSNCPVRHGVDLVGSGRGDRVRGTKGEDRVRARAGRDVIDIRAGGRDKVACGPGRDKVLRRRADRDDDIAGDCEVLRRR